MSRGGVQAQVTAIAQTPYFHDGFAADLDAVVDFYDTRFNIGFTK